MFGKSKINLSMIQPTSKVALKMSCLASANGDLDKAEKLYDFFAKDMPDLPDFEPQMPTKFQQARDAVGSAMNWFKENREDIAQAWGFIQQLRGGAPIGADAVPPAGVPPIPE